MQSLTLRIVPALAAVAIAMACAPREDHPPPTTDAGPPSDAGDLPSCGFVSSPCCTGSTCWQGGDCIGGTCQVCHGTACSGACVDTSTDSNNCGRCSHVCPPSNSCLSGQCVISQ